MTIGTLNEGPLHHSLKALYGAESAHEVPIEGYVADVHGDDDVLYEIQTAGFGSLKKKLARLVETYQVVLVHPIAETRYIVKLSDDELEHKRRKSPKKGAVSHVLDELVSIPTMLNHPNFELEVVLIEEEEFRIHDPTHVRGRHGWRVVERRLVEVRERVRFRRVDDLFGFVKHPLPDSFTTQDLADAMEEPRWLAQKLAYCLREAGAIHVHGKNGNSLLYRRAVQRRRSNDSMSS